MPDRFDDIINTRSRAATTRFSTVIEVLICLAGLGLLVENALLVRQKRELEDTLAPQIASGARLQMLGGLTLDGRFRAIPLPSAEAKLLVITFSPACPACQANQAGWTRLSSTLEQKGVRVVWVSRDPIVVTKDYCLKNRIPLSDTLADPPHRTYVQLGLARVPNTMLVGGNGQVEKVWAGRLDQAGWESLFAYFGVDGRATGAAAFHKPVLQLVD